MFLSDRSPMGPSCRLTKAPACVTILGEAMQIISDVKNWDSIFVMKKIRNEKGGNNLLHYKLTQKTGNPCYERVINSMKNFLRMIVVLSHGNSNVFAYVCKLIIYGYR